MSTLTQLPPTTNAPAIEPSNQPIPSHATYMSKAASGELGAIAESGISISTGAAAAAVTSNATEEEKTGSTNAAGTGVRILKKTMSTDSMLDDKSSTAGGQSSSGGGTPSSAKQRKYERKTKRFIWPDELHRLFVAAIFDGACACRTFEAALLCVCLTLTDLNSDGAFMDAVGLKNASPKALLGLMGAAGPDSGLTTEHLKSHLQKYRLNYERSRAEFLEFYDHSAKKNLKRRRKNGNKPGEHNTMFVFPISHKKRKGGEGGGDSDDSNSDNDSDDDAVEEMSDSTLEHTTPRGSGAGNSLLERTSSFTSMMQQDPKDPMAVAAAAAYAQRSQQQQLQIQNSILSNSAMNDPRASFCNSSSSQAQAMAAAYAANQRKVSLTGGNSSNNSSNNRAIAAAAVAAAAFRYPMGLPMGAGTGGPGSASSGGQLGELSDPQWNILSSLMSPHITGMNGGNGGGNVIPTSEGMNGGGANGGDQFQLHDEPNDLQLQMHLAMQAQMNLHRQMLTRKVEVSQHLINSQHDGNNSNNGGNNNYGLGWGANAQQQQQHHQQQQQQRQQHQQHQQQQYFQQDQQQQRAAAAAARQVLANSSHHPQMQMNLTANAAGMGNNNSSSSNQTPRPSLAPRTSNNNNNNLAATTSTMASSSLGMGNTYAAASGQRGGIPTSVGPVDVVNVLLNDNGGPDETLGANLGFDKNSGGNSGPSGATTSAAAPVDDDSLDLYRWDRIDLNVELDDDDLFGFLKS